MLIKTKQCNVCKEKKLLIFFNKDMTNKDNLAYRCKQCESIKKKLYYEKNKKQRAIYNKNWILKNKENGVNYQKKYRQTIPNAYVLGLLTNDSILKVSDIPKELVIAKKIQLQIRKYIKVQNEKC
jgi:hypothetical protein